ncbi:MAG: type II toxin-antitoxin system VapC family toxin [Candidatus Daviesbacteria bacterium]|nr:type II toxin-antitoxin system VapC family toxin [Candidatus Daviesbacteria bacterium]
MNGVLIDTDIWIDFLKKREYAIELVTKLAEQTQIFTSILTITELRAGMTTEQAEKYMPIFYAHTEIVDISKEIAEMSGEFLKEYSLKGISLASVDVLIASSAILQNCQLVTRNKKDFPMPEIKLYPVSESD